MKKKSVNSYSTADKKNEVLNRNTWMNLKNIIRIEKSQIKKNLQYESISRSTSALNYCIAE